VTEYLLAFTAGYGVICFILARSYLQPQRFVPLLPQGLEEVHIPSEGKGLDPAWCTPNLAAGKASPVVFVLAHGYGGTRDSWRELMPELAAKGIEAIAPAMPGQDASPEPQVGFGLKEAATMKRAAEWVRQTSPKVKIVYAGVSMGGAAAWLASEMDPSAAGVVSEGAYARFDEAMRTWFDRKAPGASIYLRPVVWIASVMAGLKPEDVVPLNSARKWKGRPALIIQGGDDALIARSHADRLSEASGGTLWVVEGAEHANCYGRNHEPYVEHLTAFARRVASVR
jgi:pimeloyl-ACP methyl ester carboxylesterase